MPAGWTTRHWAVALAGAAMAAVAIAVPTGIIQSPLYHRMTPVTWWDYPAWAVTAMLEGILLATYVRSKTTSRASTAQAAGGGMLSFFAVGCPVCNKLVVLAIGISGALSYWAPVQPFLAAASAAVLGYAVYRRLQGMRRCPAR